MGRADYLKLGDWNAQCDRCDFKFKASELRETWDNLYVCKDCWEPRHVSDFFRIEPDDTSVPWTRQADNKAAGVVLVGDIDKTLQMGIDTSTQNWDTVLTANRTITLSTIDAQRGDMFKIYRTGIGAFTLASDSLKTPPTEIPFVAIVEFTGTVWKLINYSTL